MEREYQRVVVGRLPGDDTPEYEVHGLPEGRDFRDPSKYDELLAPAVKVNGFAFTTEAAEWGGHGDTVTVRQRREGGTVHIRLEAADGADADTGAAVEA